MVFPLPRPLLPLLCRRSASRSVFAVGVLVSVLVSVLASVLALALCVSRISGVSVRVSSVGVHELWC
jgi:hypothetical protein